MRATGSIEKVDIGALELLNLLLRWSFSNGHSLAAWRLPGEDKMRVIVSRNVTRLKRDVSLEELAPGFVFAPFDRSGDTLFLQADYAFSIGEDKLLDPNSESEVRSHDLLSELIPGRSVSTETIKVPELPGNQPREIKKEDFIALVDKCVQSVETGLFEKVVPSRSKSVALSNGFDLADAFLALCKNYDQAFVSLTASPECGTWLGASPEELVRVFDKTIFKTVALAGTQRYIEGQNLRNVSWTQKEIEEQALVERYIISCFKKIRLREYDEHGPKTVIAGNLMHLRSEFTVNLKETNFPQLGSVMLQLLHPTSAVCGTPMESSLEFLKENEGYDRSFYSGYLGPVNVDNQINIFVNLRCMQIRSDKAVLYAGAGVTIDSIAEQEWEETEMKMNTLLTLLQKR